MIVNSLSNKFVSKSGFITRTLTAEQLKVSKNIYLEPTNDNAPVVTAVWIENTDVLHDSYPLPMTSKEKTTIKAEVDWGKGKLQQDLLQKPYDRFERMALSYGTILHPVQRNGAYFLINSVTVHELYF